MPLIKFLGSYYDHESGKLIIRYDCFDNCPDLFYSEDRWEEKINEIKHIVKHNPNCKYVKCNFNYKEGTQIEGTILTRELIQFIKTHNEYVYVYDKRRRQGTKPFLYHPMKEILQLYEKENIENVNRLTRKILNKFPPGVDFIIESYIGL